MRYSISSVSPPSLLVFFTSLDSKQLHSCNSDHLVPNPRYALAFPLLFFDFSIFRYSGHTTANVQLVYEFEKSLTTHGEQKKKENIGRSEEHSLAHVSYFYIHIALRFYCANDGNVPLCFIWRKKSRELLLCICDDMTIEDGVSEHSMA